MTFVELQPRDRELLVGLWRFGVLLRDHIQILYFATCARRRVNRRLARLAEAGLLTGSPIPLGAFPLAMPGVLRCPGQFAYQLSTTGVSIVAEALGKDMDEVRRRVRYSPSYVAHAIGVASVAVALARQAEPQGYRIESYLCESETWHSFQWREASGPWESTIIRPDALAQLTREGQSLQFLIEADMATQGKHAFIEKLRSYALYQRTGAYSKRHGTPLTLAIITTSESRLALLQRLAQQEGIAFANFTTFAALSEGGPFTPIWHDATGSRKELL